MFLPLVNRLGARVERTLIKAGFYPAGGGRFTITIEPAPRLARLELLERGEIVERRVTAKSANLPASHRGARSGGGAAVHELARGRAARSTPCRTRPAPATSCWSKIASEHVTEICTGFGEIGTSAEGVAERAAKEARRYLAAGVPVGAYLADQLLPVLALGDGRIVPDADAVTPLRDERRRHPRSSSMCASRRSNESRDMTRVNVEVK